MAAGHRRAIAPQYIEQFRIVLFIFQVSVPTIQNSAIAQQPMLQAERRKAEDDRAREAMTRMMLSKEHLSELKQREMIRLQARPTSPALLRL